MFGYQAEDQYRDPFRPSITDVHLIAGNGSVIEVYPFRYLGGYCFGGSYKIREFIGFDAGLQRLSGYIGKEHQALHLDATFLQMKFGRKRIAVHPRVPRENIRISGGDTLRRKCDQDRKCYYFQYS
jgi:hypothetical protein